MLKRFMAGATVLGVFLAFGVSAGMSATPRQIYRDLADNGRLDHKYSTSDLNKAFKNPTVQGYKKPTQTKVVRPKASPTLKEKKKVGVLPFTGLDLTIMAGGAVLLVLMGLGLRVLVREN